MEIFVLSSGSIAVISALVIQYLKKSNWFTFLSTEAKSQRANMIFSLIVSFLTSLGLSYSFNPHTGELIINGLMTMNIMNSLIHWAWQHSMQHLAYKVGVAPTELQAKTAEALKQLVDLIGKK